MKLPFIAHLPAKQASRWAIVVAVLITLLAFQYAFRPTLRLLSERSKTANAQYDPVALSKQISRHKEELTNIDNIIGSTEYDRNRLFERCGVLAEQFKVDIRSFSPEEIFLTETGVEKIINQLSVVGDFKSILTLAYQLEEVEKMATLVSVQYDYRENRRTRRKELTALLVLENLRIPT